MDFSHIKEDDYNLIGNPNIDQILGLDSNYNQFLEDLLNEMDEEAKNNYLDSINNSTGSQRIAFNQNNIEEMSIFPNPVQDKLYIYISEIGSKNIVKGHIINTLGIEVNTFHYDFTNTYTLDTSKLEKGLYYLTIKINSKTITKKFTKQ